MQTKLKPNQYKTLKAASPLLIRTVAFLAVFVLISGILGPRIISHGLVNKDGFQIYGGSGKALLFGVLSLLLLINRKGFTLKLRDYHVSNVVWLVLSSLSAITAWYGVGKLIEHATDLNWPLLTNISLLASVVFAAGGTFGPANIRLLIRTYRKQILISLVLAILFFGFLTLVYGLWQVLAIVVLHSVRWLLSGIGLHSAVLPPRTLLFSKFGINIAQYCSGIESIALFTALFALVGVLDWHRFNHRRLLNVFLPALLVLFGFNILRVAVLILAGYYINTQIAFSLFHTYAGMLFFILYSILFWALSYKWLLIRGSHSNS